MTGLQEQLFALADEKYAAFQAKLAPTVDPASCIGVRVPELRKLAASFCKTAQCEEFLQTLPHSYYDENLLHSVILSKQKDFEKCLENVKRFLPYVDNWAVCDTLRPAVFAKNRDALLPEVMAWVASKETYACRFGIDMLMTYYLDDSFLPEFPETVSRIRSDEYYVNMMTAWYFATALAKRWDDIIPYIEEHRLDRWTHNRAIQKSVESFRISDERKEYLKGLRDNGRA